MRAEPGNLLLPVNWVYIRKLLVLIYLDELTPTQRLGRVLPLGEVSRKLGFKLAVFRDQQEHFFLGQLASGPSWRLFLLTSHTC